MYFAPTPHWYFMQLLFKSVFKKKELYICHVLRWYSLFYWYTLLFLVDSSCHLRSLFVSWWTSFNISWGASMLCLSDNWIYLWGTLLGTQAQWAVLSLSTWSAHLITSAGFKFCLSSFLVVFFSFLLSRFPLHLWLPVFLPCVSFKYSSLGFLKV